MVGGSVVSKEGFSPPPYTLPVNWPDSWTKSSLKARFTTSKVECKAGIITGGFQTLENSTACFGNFETLLSLTWNMYPSLNTNK